MHGSTTIIPLRTGSSQPVKPLRLPTKLCKTQHAKRGATGMAKMWKSRQNLCKTMTLSKSTASGIMDVQTKRKETNHAHTLRQDYPEPIKRIGGSMKLGDRIKLHWEKKGMFSDSEPEIVDGEFIVIGVSYGMPHCFGEHYWSTGFNSFDYAEVDTERPDIVKRGSVYVPDASYLDKKTVSDLAYGEKTVSWEVIEEKV